MNREHTSGQWFFAGRIEGDEYVFDTFESGHLVKVLRKREGDPIVLTDGKGRVYEAVITAAHPRKTVVRITGKRLLPPPERRLHVFMAPTKNMDRFEWFLEKATELGVWKITPLITRNTGRKKLNYDRLEKIIVSAVKQSKRAYKPVLHPAITWKNIPWESHRFFAALCEADRYRNKDYAQARRAAVIVGPEGGFAPDEREELQQRNIPAIRLSAYRLRAETAGITAVCRFYCNDS
ncbi:MAG: 16S rRNA (uracil(1498)-N(3))-methyltransferase [Chlorobi bacterium]|nr:16S rRNA (uracil(1498)-N(3))-methyltransferase [Chlorobiota bacterium]